MIDDERQRRIMAIVVLIFIILIAGCATPFGPTDGRGDLTVEVTNQAGEPAAEQPVMIRNRATGKRIFKGTTDTTGTVSTTLDFGTYVVATGDKTKTIQIDGDTEVSFQIVTTPPESVGTSLVRW